MGLGSSAQKAAVEAGLNHLAVGVSKEEAEALWKHYDKNKDGELNRSEAQAMLADIIEKTKAGQQEEKKKLAEQVKALQGNQRGQPKLPQEALDGADERLNVFWKDLGGWSDKPNLNKMLFNKNAPKLLGLSASECNELLQKYASEPMTWLKKGEARRMLTALAVKAGEEAEARIAKLDEALKDESSVDKLLDAFDVTRDGKVSKAEFIQKVMEGYDVKELAKAEEGASSDEPPSKKAKTEE